MQIAWQFWFAGQLLPDGILTVPHAYAVALSSVFCLLFQGHNLTTICQQMVKGISSFSLMAVPFFITMGCLMGSGGISEKLIALANACVGWMRGGMAMVNIVASYFFWRYLRFCFCRYGFSWFHPDSHDGGPGIR